MSAPTRPGRSLLARVAEHAIETLVRLCGVSAVPLVVTAPPASDRISRHLTSVVDCMVMRRVWVMAEVADPFNSRMPRCAPEVRAMKSVSAM